MNNKFTKSKYFEYDPHINTISSIIEFLDSLGYSAQITKRLAYYIPLKENTENVGYWVNNLDISIEFPYNDPFYGYIGRIDMPSSMQMKYSPDINSKIFNKLRKKFAIPRTELNKRANLPDNLLDK